MARVGFSHYPVVDVPDLITLICGHREEAFPFDKYVAILTFSMWLRAPTKPAIVELAETVAAGQVILAVYRGKRKHPKAQSDSIINQIAKNVFWPLKAAEALADPCMDERLYTTEKQSLPFLFDVGAIVAFILKCPLEMKPSLNKALCFIDEGGFANIFTIGAKERPYKVSYANLKTSWSLLAISSPFSLAAERLSVQSILNLPPDVSSSIPKATKLLSSVTTLRRYFGHALCIQNALLSRLDKLSLRRIQFVTFPKTIITHPLETIPFEPDQLELIKKYRAPKSL